MLLQFKPVRGMSIRNLTSLGSNLAPGTDLKRIQTQHSLCCDFEATHWSGGRVQVWVQVCAPARHLAISQKAVPEGNRRFSGKNQRPSSLGRYLALLGQVGWASTNTGRFRAGGSRCQGCGPATDYTKCRSTVHAPDLNMDSGFLPMQRPSFLAL